MHTYTDSISVSTRMRTTYIDAYVLSTTIEAYEGKLQIPLTTDT